MNERKMNEWMSEWMSGEHAGSYDMWHAEKSDDDNDEPTTSQRDNNFRRWFTPLNHSHMYNINRSGTPLTWYEWSSGLLDDRRSNLIRLWQISAKPDVRRSNLIRLWRIPAKPASGFSLSHFSQSIHLEESGAWLFYLYSWFFDGYVCFHRFP